MMRLTRCAGWAAMAVVAIAAITVVGCGGGGTPVVANTGTITGLILHAGTGLPLGGIPVSAGGVQTTTNNNGQFTLSGVPAGQQTVNVNPPPERDLILPPSVGPIVVNVQAGQTTALGQPILLIDGSDAPPDPPVI